MTENIKKLREEFRKRFGAEPTAIAAAPGRVNLIGEHTDYMGGLVLPVAINRETLFALRPVDGNAITGFSLNFSEEVQDTSGEFNRHHPVRWFRYVLGVLKEIRDLGHVVGGFNFCVYGNVPIGSGLSSSATLSVAALTALQSAFGFQMGKREAALLCRRAENDFVGVQCGIMDQFISIAGARDHALRIDCSDLSIEPIPAHVPGCTWMVIDSKKKRGLVNSEYNFRIVQCLNGLRFLQSAFPRREIVNLRDVSVAELLSVREKADAMVFKRVRHVVTENLRVIRVCEALKSGDVRALGECLNASHLSLRDDFEVSCPELNALVEILSGARGVVGARLTGAGFGGCVIALVRDEMMAEVTAAVLEKYPRMFPGQRAKIEIWPIRIADGAKLVYSAQAVEKIAG